MNKLNSYLSKYSWMIHHRISIHWKERHHCHLCSCCSRNWEMKWSLNLNKPITFACRRWLQETTVDKMWHWWSLNWWQVWKRWKRKYQTLFLVNLIFLLLRNAFKTWVEYSWKVKNSIWEISIKPVRTIPPDVCNIWLQISMNS